MINTIACVSVVVFGVVAVAVIVWLAVQAAKESRVIDARMKAAGSRLQDFFAEEAAKYALMALYSAGPNADPLERVSHVNDSSAQWADLLFSRYAGTGAALVYDDDRTSWVASVPLFEEGPLVGFTLDATDPKKPMEALVAAVGVIVDDAPPVIATVDEPSGVSVRFAEERSRWEVYQPCEQCGGGWLRTHFSDPGFAALARWTAQAYLTVLRPDDTENPHLLACAHCLSREMRANERVCHQPTCWYDTLTDQWMLSDSLGEDVDAVCVPLGIETFFVNQRVVLAAANHQLGN